MARRNAIAAGANNVLSPKSVWLRVGSGRDPLGENNEPPHVNAKNSFPIS